jgi:hypothetical protein
MSLSTKLLASQLYMQMRTSKLWSFDDSHSSKYQKFKVDELPRIADLRQDWTYKDLIILTTSKRLIKLTLLKSMAKINISSTTSGLL